jgi:hypothetical protein
VEVDHGASISSRGRRASQGSQQGSRVVVMGASLARRSDALRRAIAIWTKSGARVRTALRGDLNENELQYL